VGPRNQTKIPGLSSLCASSYTDHIIPTEREREGGGGERGGGGGGGGICGV